MANTINDYNDFFVKAKQALYEYAELEKEESKLQEEEIRLSKALEAENKALNDNTAITLKKRLKEITDTYDEEIAKSQDKLKKSKGKREKAKNQGIKERISDETLDLRTANKDLKTLMKEEFKKAGVPGFCKTGLYYALYFPRHIGEYFKLLIMFLIFFVAIPCGIYFFAIPEPNLYYMIGIYIAVVIIFGGIYVLIGNMTKVKHIEVLKSGRKILDDILKNNKKIKSITKGINNDKDDGKYDLASFDDEIAHIEQNIADLNLKRQEAINKFETVTKNIIIDEIYENVRPRLDKLNADYQGVSERLKAVEEGRKESSLFISENYEAYLGKEFTSIDKIEALEGIFNQSLASNISEAIDVYKNHKNE